MLVLTNYLGTSLSCSPRRPETPLSLSQLEGLTSQCCQKHYFAKYSAQEAFDFLLTSILMLDPSLSWKPKTLEIIFSTPLSLKTDWGFSRIPLSPHPAYHLILKSDVLALTRFLGKRVSLLVTRMTTRYLSLFWLNAPFLWCLLVFKPITYEVRSSSMSIFGYFLSSNVNLSSES